MAVPPSLPLGIERTASARSGASGSASGTFRGEWQCNSHCHSASSVLGSALYTATRRRACWAAHRTLPLGGERTGRHVQGRVAVPPSLPLGGERTALVRSGPSGSASGTFVVEWQCVSHCHSVVSVLGSAPYTATRHRAYRIDTIRGEWQCVSHCHSVVNVRDGTFRVEWQCRPHCHSASSVPHWYDQGRVAVRPVRSGASGSATHTATRW